MSNIYKNIWIGAWEEASDENWLKKNNITHILNTSAELEDAFPRKFIYKHLQILSKDNFDVFPYLDQGADFILKAIEDGNLLIHCYRGTSRAPCVFIAFLMKYFGWDYMRCLKCILNKRSMVRLHKNCKKAIDQYYEELKK